jgi:hypothetical protein
MTQVSIAGCEPLPFQSVQRPGRYFVRELPNCVGDPAPGRCAVVIAVDRKLVGARGALHVGVLAVALEHQGRGAPDVDFGYHAGKVLAVAAYVEYNNR